MHVRKKPRQLTINLNPSLLNATHGLPHSQVEHTVCVCTGVHGCMCVCVYEAAAQLTSLSVNYINIGAPRFMLSLCLRLSACVSVSVSIGLSMSVVVAVTVGASVGVSVVRFSCCSHKLLWRSLRSD